MGLQFRQIREFAKSIDNVIVIRPKMKPKTIFNKYGYPIISKMSARFIRDLANPTQSNENTRRLRLTGINSKGKKNPSMMLAEKWQEMFFDIKNKEKLIYTPKFDFKVSEQCCDKMKKEPFERFEERTGLKPIIGTMADDSKNRRKSVLDNGCNAFDLDKPQSRPLSFWTEQDILQYIKQYNIPYCKDIYGDICYKYAGDRKNNELYTTGESRTGCVFCGFGCHLESDPNRFQRLYYLDKQLYDYSINKLDMKKPLDFIGVDYKPNQRLIS